MDYADKVLAPGIPVGAVALAAATILAAAGIAVGVLWSRGVTILVDNINCGEIDLSGVGGFVPGIEFPGRIDSGERGTVRVPRAFVGDLRILEGVLTVGAFGREIDVTVDRLDLEDSTWNDSSLVGLLGPISVGERGENTLILRCR